MSRITVAGSGHLSIISQLFLSYFLTISQKFLKFSYFTFISYLFLIYFPVISRFWLIPHLLTPINRQLLAMQTSIGDHRNPPITTDW